jgi:hypothetical protein
MKRKMMVSLLVLMIAFIFNTTTFAQVTPDASTSPQTKRPAFFSSLLRAIGGESFGEAMSKSYHAG